MEVFSMLRHWRGGGGDKGGATDANTDASTAAAATISVANYDDGPFFDLEFSVPQEEEEGRSSNTSSEEEGRESTATESKWSYISVMEPGRPSSNSSLLGGDDDNEAVIKGRLVPVGPPDATTIFSDDTNGKHSQFPVSLRKSATRFRIFFLRTKKHSSAPPPTPYTAEEFPAKEKNVPERFLTVKVKMEESSFASLFARDGTRKAKESPDSGKDSVHGLGEKEAKRAKIVAQRYLKAIKPLYHRVSKRNGEKVSFSGNFPVDPPAKETTSPGSSPDTPQPAAPSGRQGSFPVGLRIVYKHLGKGRPASPPSVLAQSQRRDDSLLQQEDGIQSAIIHCKQSLITATD